MARPLWSGTIQISLVGFEVEIYPATSTTRPISFHEIDRNTLGRVHRQSVSAGPPPAEESAEADKFEEAEAANSSMRNQTSLHIAPKADSQEAASQIAEDTSLHAVERADIVKGYEYEKGKYAIVEPEELKNLRLAGKKSVEISQFARSAEINPALYEKPYFVFPKEGPQATAFAVIRQSMIDSGMVAVGEIVFSGRQHLMTLAPPHDPKQPGMMLYTLRFAAELRDANDYSKGVENIDADPAQLNMAKQLVEAYAQPFEVSRFKDQYEDALRELVQAKISNLPAPVPEAKKAPGKVVDLMEALRRSLAEKSPSAPNPESKAAMESTANTKASKKPAASSTAKGKPARAASAKKAKLA